MSGEEILSLTERLVADLRRIRAEEGRESAEPFQVLIVEDNVEFADSLKALAEAVGCKARVVGTKWDAEQSLREPTDIVFLDLNLPDACGGEVFPVVRELKPDAHIIVVTAYPALLDLLPTGQYFGVCLKPIDVETIRDAIAKYRRPGQKPEPDSGPQNAS